MNFRLLVFDFRLVSWLSGQYPVPGLSHYIALHCDTIDTGWASCLASRLWLGGVRFGSGRLGSSVTVRTAASDRRETGWGHLGGPVAV